MAENSKTETETYWQKRTRTLWPWYAIEGDGRLCCVIECTRRVVLTNNPMEARMLQSARCVPRCSHDPAYGAVWHSIRELREPTPARAQYHKRAHWHRMVEDDD